MVKLDDVLRNAADNLQIDYFKMKAQFEIETKPNELLSITASANNQWIQDISC